MRPKDADSAATFDRIVAAALDEVDHADDPTKVSLRAIAARAELSLGTIHYYFPSRDELLEACLDAYYVRFSALVQQLIAESAEAPDDPAGHRYLVEHTVRSLYRFLVRERSTLRLRIVTSVQRGELHPRRQDEFVTPFIAAGAAALSGRVSVGELETRLAMDAAGALITRFVLMSDSEVEHVTGLDPVSGRASIEAFVVSSVRRMVRPSDG